MKLKSVFNFFPLLFGILFIILIFIAGCGRKGDPIPIVPPQEKAAKTSSEKDTGAGSVQGVKPAKSDGT